MKYFQERKLHLQERTKSIVRNSNAGEVPFTAPDEKKSPLASAIYPTKYDCSFTESETSIFSDDSSDCPADLQDESQQQLENEYYDKLVSRYASMYYCDGISSIDDDYYDIEACTARAQSPLQQKKEKKEKRNVQFSNIKVREYSITLGDHPFSDSYPLSLDWEYTLHAEMDLDLYEKRKCESGWGSTGRGSSRKQQINQLTTLQRRLRLTQVAGIHPCDLVKMERQRIKRVELEIFEAALRQCDEEEDEDEYDDNACHDDDDENQDCLVERDDDIVMDDDASDGSLDPESLFM